MKKNILFYLLLLPICLVARSGIGEINFKNKTPELIISGTATFNKTAAGKSINPCGSILIRTEPASLDGCAGGNNLSFSVAGTPNSGALSYQWEKRARGLTNDSDFTTIIGETNATYIISPQARDNGIQLRCVLSDGCGTVSETKSAFATLTILEVPSKVSSPQNAAICENNPVVIGGTSFQGEKLSYQWSFSGTVSGFFSPVEGGRVLNLSLDAAQISHAGYYRCEATNLCGSDRSGVALLTVKSNVALGTAPSSQISCEEKSVTFNVSAGGATPYHYVWKKRNTLASNDPWTTVGQNSSSFTISSVSAQDNAFYQVTVSGACGSPVESPTFSLTVNPRISWNSSCDFLRSVNGLCKSATRVYDINNCIVANNNQGNPVVTYLDGNILSGGLFRPSLYSVGEHILMAKKPYDNGDDIISMTIEIAEVPQFSTALPVMTYACPRSYFKIDAPAATGGGTKSYRWTDEGNSILSSINSLEYSTLPENSDNKQYKVMVTNQCGSAVSSSTTIAVYGAPNIQTESAAIATVCSGESTTLSVNAGADDGNTYHRDTNKEVLKYQWYISTDDGSTFNKYTGRNATRESLTYLAIHGHQFKCEVSDFCVVNGVSVNKVVSEIKTIRLHGNIAITAPASLYGCNGGENLNFSVTGTANKGSLSYQWQRRNNGLTNDSDFTAIIGETNATYTISPLTGDNGAQFRCVLSDGCGAVNQTAGAFATLTILAPPSVRTNPQDATICEDISAVISGTAFRGENLNYQWSFSRIIDGLFSPLEDGLALNLSINAAQISNAGYYYCKATNLCGHATTEKALLTVNRKVQIQTPPTDQRGCIGREITFNVTANGTTPYHYHWEKQRPSTSWMAVGNNSNLYNIRGLTWEHSNTIYRVTVSGACGTPAVSPTFSLIVNATPDYPVVDPVSRCGAGTISSNVRYPIEGATYRWLSLADNGNEEFVYTGNSYLVTLDEGAIKNFKVFTILNGCTSTSFATSATSISYKSVNIGGDLNLCPEQTLYNLWDDIADNNAKGGQFTLTHNNKSKGGGVLDPLTYRDELGNKASLTIVVTYTPSEDRASKPFCDRATTRNVSIVKQGNSDLIDFKIPDPKKKEVILCINSGKVNLATLVSRPHRGSWEYGNGKNYGLTGGGIEWYYEPNTDNYDAVNPNELRYTVNAYGCTITDVLKVYVKHNIAVPIVSISPDIVCQDESFWLNATVNNNSPLTYVYNNVIEKGKVERELSRQNPVTFQVLNDTEYSVYSLDEFQCHSEKKYVTVHTPYGSGILTTNYFEYNHFFQVVSFSFDGPSTSLYEWDFGDNSPIGREQNPGKFYGVNGKFTPNLKVTGKNSSGKTCPSRIFVSREITINQSDKTYAGLSKDNTDGIHPIPAMTVLYCHGKWIEGAATVSVISMDGKMYELPLTNDSVDVSFLSSGVYVIQCQSARFKFIKN